MLVNREHPPHIKNDDVSVLLYLFSFFSSNFFHLFLWLLKSSCAFGEKKAAVVILTTTHIFVHSHRAHHIHKAEHFLQIFASLSLPCALYRFDHSVCVLFFF
jgi:hypothetical protein